MNMVEKIKGLRKCQKIILILSVSILFLFTLVFIRVSYEGLTMFSCVSGLIAAGIVIFFTVLRILEMLTEPS